MYICIYVNIFIGMYVCMYVCMYVHMYICIYLYICIYVYLHNYVHSYFICGYSHIYIYYTHLHGGPYHPPLWQSHGSHGKHEPWKQRSTRRRTVPLWHCNLAKLSTILSWLGLWFCLFGAVVKTARKDHIWRSPSMKDHSSATT